MLSSSNASTGSAAIAPLDVARGERDRSFRRPLPTIGLAGLLLAACASEPSPEVDRLVFALGDPAGILDDVVGDLSLVVWPMSAGACDAMTGVVSPAPTTMPTVERTFMVGGSVMFNLDAGAWIVRIQGNGTDRRTGRTGLIASGCVAFEVEAGATREVRVVMREQTVSGVCPDGIVDADEMCDDNNAAAGDGCDAQCQTEEEAINAITVEGDQRRPALASAADSPFALAWDATRPAPGIRHILRGPDARPIESPRFQSVDADVLDGLPSPGAQVNVAVAASGSRYVVAWEDQRTTGTEERSDVRVRLFDYERAALDVDVNLSDPTLGSQSAPSVAMASDGTIMVVWDDESVSGSRGRIIPSGFTSPQSGPFDLTASPNPNARFPVVVSSPPGFLAAWSGPAGDGTNDVFYRRFASSGMATTGEMRAAEGEAGAGNQDQVAAAALTDGMAETLVVWVSSTGDGDGTCIRGRVVDNAGMPVGQAVTINTTTAGDQVNPTVAAGNGAFAVAWEDVATGQVRMRVLDRDGTFRSNRARGLAEPTADFQVSIASSMALAPAAAFGGNGILLVVWEDPAAPAPDAMGRGIRGRSMPLP